MKVLGFALLVLVQLSPIFVHVNGEAVNEYKCEEKKTESITVSNAVARLTKGCVFDATEHYIGIKFDLEAMYKAADGKTPVVIYIDEAAFINSYIKVINAHLITGTPRPLEFTMVKTNMSGMTMLMFGSDEGGSSAKLPPNSRIRISESNMNILSIGSSQSYLFTFHSLQLVDNSSIEISQNVIAMECEGCNMMSVFRLLSKNSMMISDKSSFTLRNNTVTMKGHTTNSKCLRQSVWFQDTQSSLTISKTSTYTWESNIISIVGHNVNDLLWQCVWLQLTDSPLTISEKSIYKWSNNSISMDGHDITKKMLQYVWYSYPLITISAHSQFLLYSNIMLLLAKNYEAVLSYVMRFDNYESKAITTISEGSSMVWRDNCIGIGQAKAGRKRVFHGNWSITGDKSELLLDDNYITTNDKYQESGNGLSEMVWGPTQDTDITINTKGKLTIRNTKVYTNTAADGETGILWNSPSYTSTDNMKLPDMKWSVTPAKLSNGSPIPTLDVSNLRQYMCAGLPNMPLAVVDATVSGNNSTLPNPQSGKPVLPNPTKAANSKSATAISSTIPAVLITSVVFLYLYNY